MSRLLLSLVESSGVRFVHMACLCHTNYLPGHDKPFNLEGGIAILKIMGGPLSAPRIVLHGVGRASLFIAQDKPSDLSQMT